MYCLASFAVLAASIIGRCAAADSEFEVSDVASYEEYTKDRPTDQTVIGLRPAINWNTDLSKLSHLNPNSSCSLFYSQHNNSAVQQSIAEVHFDLQYPVVVLDHSAYVEDVTCASEVDMTIELNSKDAFEYVQKAWAPYAKETTDFLAVIGFFPTCSPSFDLGQRSVHLVDDFKFSVIPKTKKTKERYILTCDVEHKDLGTIVKGGSVSMGTYVPNLVAAAAAADAQAARVRARRGLWLSVREGVEIMHEGVIGKRSLWGSIGDGLKSIGDGIKNIGSTVGTALEDTATKVVDKIAEGFKLDKSYHMAVNKTSYDMQTPFQGRMGKKLLDSAQLQVYCVECALQGEVNFGVNVAFGLEGFTSGKVTFRGSLFTSLGLGIDSQSPNLRVPIKTWSKMLFQQGIPELSAPGVLIVGPWIQANIIAKIELGLVGKIAAGISLDWEAAQFEIDIMDPTASTASGWEPKFNKMLDIEGDVSIYATFGIPISLNMGIDILAGKFTKGARLVSTPSIRLSATEHFDLEWKNATQSLQASLGPAANCPGAILGLTVQNDLVAGIIKNTNSNYLQYKILHTQFFAMAYCWNHGIFINPTSPAAAASPATKTVSTIGTTATATTPGTTNLVEAPDITQAFVDSSPSSPQEVDSSDADVPLDPAHRRKVRSWRMPTEPTAAPGPSSAAFLRRLRRTNKHMNNPFNIEKE